MPSSLGAAVRDAFDSRHVPSPGLENRVLGAIAREKPRPSHAPRLAAPLGAALTLVVVALLAVPLALQQIGLAVPGIGSDSRLIHAYSLAAVSGQTVFVVQRDISIRPGPPESAHNYLLESSDGGRTWHERLRFDGVYFGMRLQGSQAVVWAQDNQPRDCKPIRNGYSCSQPASRALLAYRSEDSGLTWQSQPASPAGVGDAFFLDGRRGWSIGSLVGPTRQPEALYATTDGGATWAQVGTLPAAAPAAWVYGVGNHQVVFANEPDGSLRGWYDAGSRLFTSADGGASWQPVALAPPTGLEGWTAAVGQVTVRGAEGVLPVAFRDPNGPDNATPNRIYLYVSHDGGASWSDPRPAPAGFEPVGDILSASVLDPGHVWLTSLSASAGDRVQAKPAVALTADGGKTWRVAQGTPRILEMIFTDPEHGFALDVSGPRNTNGIVRTDDGGLHWHRVAVPIVAGT